MNVSGEKKDNIFLEVLLSIVCFLVLFFLGKYIYVTVALLGIPFIYLAVKRNYLLGIGAYIVCLGAFMFTDLIYAGTVLCLTLIPVITASYMIRNRKEVWQSLSLTGIACLVGVVMMVIFLHYMGKGEISSYLTSLLVEKAKTSSYFRMLSYSLIITRNIATGASVNEIVNIIYSQDMAGFIATEESFISLKLVIEEMAPNILALFLFYTSLFYYFTSKHLLKMSGQKVAESKQFDEWQMPRDHGFYMLAVLVLGYVFMLLGEKSYQAPGMVMVYLATYIFRLVGSTYVSHMLRPMIKSKALRGFLGILVYLILPNLAMILGLADQILDLRHRLFIRRL